MVDKKKGFQETTLTSDADISKAFTSDEIKKAAEGVAAVGGIEQHLESDGKGHTKIGATVIHVSVDKKG
jgi:hypothetical protein